VEYFNKKEDIIDLELTPFGEALLSRGDFKAEYYTFFDDEILYDANYASITTEKQNQIKKRIKEVPRLKTQYQFRGGDFPKYITQKIIESFPGETIITPSMPPTIQKMCGIVSGLEGQGAYTNILPMDEFMEAMEKISGCKDGPGPRCPDFDCWDVEVPGPAGTTTILPGGFISEHIYPNPNFAGNALPLPLGHCNYESEFAPAWDLNMLYGRTTKPIMMLTSTMHPYLRIPQIDVDVTYESRVGPTEKTDEVKEKVIRLKEYEELHTYNYKFSDGTFIDFDEDYLVLDVEEMNVPFLKDNFDIEVFKIETVPRLSKDGVAGFEDDLVPLSFVKKPEMMVDEKGLLKNLDEQIAAQEQEIELQLLTPDNSYVEHYFNIWVDDEIETELMCVLKPTPKKKGVFISDPWGPEKVTTECVTAKGSFSTSQVYPAFNEDQIPECDE